MVVHFAILWKFEVKVPGCDLMYNKKLEFKRKFWRRGWRMNCAGDLCHLLGPQQKLLNLVVSWSMEVTYIVEISLLMIILCGFWSEMHHEDKRIIILSKDSLKGGIPCRSARKQIPYFFELTQGCCYTWLSVLFAIYQMMKKK